MHLSEDSRLESLEQASYNLSPNSSHLSSNYPKQTAIVRAVTADRVPTQSLKRMDEVGDVDDWAQSEAGYQRVRADSLTDAATQEIWQVLDLLQLHQQGRILLIEPFSQAIGQRLRRLGFSGELTALLRSPLEAKQHLYDQIYAQDWTDLPPGENIASTGPFHMVVALELSRIIPRQQLPAVLCWLATLLAPQGYLIVGEPLTPRLVEQLEPQLLQSNLLLAADERLVESDWQWSMSRWQLRPGDSGRLTGQLVPTTLSNLQRQTSLRHALVASYREVFGGDEWGEWMRCPACQRHYSRSEYEQLQPPDQCVCGTDLPLEVYHPAETMLAELGEQLADPAMSHLYVRKGATDNIEAFIWGYLASPTKLVHDIVPMYEASEQQKFYQSLLHLLEDAGITDSTAPIYHQAYIGALDQIRSLSLVRSLFTRMCQFALDKGASVVVTATIPTVNVYHLLQGIGMKPVYTFPQSVSTMPASHLDTAGVILGGEVKSLLSIMSQESDRALVVRVARYMKQLRALDRNAAVTC